MFPTAGVESMVQMFPELRSSHSTHSFLISEDVPAYQDRRGREKDGLRTVESTSRALKDSH